MSARILLPLWPHIKKYIFVQYGKEMSVGDRGVIPFLLLNMLEQHKKEDPATVRPNQKLIDHKKFFPYPIFIWDNYQVSKGLYLSPTSIRRFNESVDDMLREEMYRWCKHPNSTDSTVDYDILRFREWYGITEDELPFDNLKRWYYRERQRLDDRVRIEIKYEPQMELFY
jgi:hypothetical protein